MNAIYKFSLLFSLCIILGSPILCAQDYWYVILADKDSSLFESGIQFDSKAIERREKFNIGWHSTDWPVNPAYTFKISEIVDSVRFELKWFNAVSVMGSKEQLDLVSQLPFVVGVEKFHSANFHSTGTEEALKDSTKVKRLLKAQRDLLGLDAFKELGLDGSGVRIAILDAGFKKVDKHEAFKHLREENRIIATRNFYSPKKKVYGHSGHGTAVLGCIAGKYNETQIGAAPGAEILLARTEHRIKEKIIEEDCWLAAVQWADENGADLISSSLGYNTPRYTYENMDGHFTKVSQAARWATRKGMLVINSAGNEGASKFKFINAPADVDSVLTVGAVFPNLRVKMPFSSVGPNAAGKPKPDISAPGYVYSASGSGGYSINAGTSFSCPLIAGFAACLMQQNPLLKPIDIARKLRGMGHLYPYYDYGHGTGVPDANLLLKDSPNNEISSIPTFSMSLKGDSVLISFPAEIWDIDTTIKRKPFYFHIETEPGKLSAYTFDVISKNKKYLVLNGDWPDGAIMRIWFDGFLFEKVLPFD